MNWGLVFSFLAAGGLGGLGTFILVWPQIRKIRAETRKVDVDAALAVDSAEDAHWQSIVKTQAEAIVEPLRTEVAALRGEVAGLRTEIEALRTRYWRSIHYIRDLLAWIAKHLPNADPGPPVIPADIAQDV